MADKESRNEVLGSVKDAFKKRLNSPVYGTFIISWAAFHWKFLYVTFFVSEENICEATGRLKSDYVRDILFNASSWENFFWSFLFWALPFFVTYLIIWVFPKHITTPAYIKDLETKTERRILKLEKEGDLLEKEKAIEERRREKESLKISSVLDELERAKMEKEIEKKDPEKIWIKEFEEFRESSYYEKFEEIIRAVYEKGGNYKKDFKVPTWDLNSPSLSWRLQYCS